jgi:hypothetical protein
VLLAICNALADGTDHVASFANTNADLSLFVADNNDGSEAHLFAAFNGFGDPSDLYDALLPFGIAVLAATTAATIATSVTTAAAAAATTLLLLLPLGRRWYISCARYGVGIGLRRRICHG